MAHVFMLDTEEALVMLPDIRSYNLYYGWYVGEPEENDEWFDRFHKAHPDTVIGLSEYGADANPQYQSASPEKGDYTETYQALYHEHMLKMWRKRPYIWAMHVWNMFDFAADVTPNSVNGPNTGFYNGGTAAYTKYIDAPEEWADRRVLVSFDGVSGAAKVILNGHVMGRHHYGYTPFAVDLTKQMKLGKRNRLAVVVSNADEQNSRWYPGAGIYRHAHLLTAPKLHIADNGIFAHTDHIVGKDAFVIVETTVEDHTAEDQELWVALEFHRLLETGEREPVLEERAAACGAVKVHVPAGNSRAARTQIMVERADIWDINHPSMYQITAKLVTKRPVFVKRPCADGGNIKAGIANAEITNEEFAGAGITDADILDTETVRFGIRTITVDSKNGFMLNGRSVKLKGGCIHHDNGILGAASFRDSEYRKVMLHKKNGYNALRFAHILPAIIPKIMEKLKSWTAMDGATVPTAGHGSPGKEVR